MHDFMNSLRELNFLSVTVRLALAMFFGGTIGLERRRKYRGAGFRTYMLVCLGAALTMLLGQYESHMLATLWDGLVPTVSGSTDVSRFSAQVINGIGFLGAGTIVVTGHQRVKGLTTAAGLWSAACMGLAIGAGFYEAVVLGWAMILVCVCVLPAVENAMIERARHINLYVEFSSLDDLGGIISQIKAQNARIYSVELDRGHKDRMKNPGAVFFIRMNKAMHHSRMIAAISELHTVCMIEEI